MASGKITRTISTEHLNILYKRTTNSSGNVSFNLGDRGAGIVFIQQNGADASVYAVTVSNENVVHHSKILGQEVSINSNSASNVLYSISNWSSVTIITSDMDWKEN